MPGSAAAHLAASLDQLHAAFLSILPRIELHGHVYFRHVRCPFKREDYIAEMVALSWKWFVRLVERGKDPTTFPTALASFAARAVRSGRRVCGQAPAKDVLSAVAQWRHGFVVEKLPDCETLTSNPLTDALRDNTKSPPDEQAAFRLDFPAWRRTYGERNRRVLDDLMMGERALDVSRKYCLSPGRVSQLRHEFLEDWGRFCGLADEAG